MAKTRRQHLKEFKNIRENDFREINDSYFYYRSDSTVGKTLLQKQDQEQITALKEKAETALKDKTAHGYENYQKLLDDITALTEKHWDDLPTLKERRKSYSNSN